MENAVYLIIGILPLFYTFYDKRDYGRPMTYYQNPRFWCTTPKLYVRSCTGSFFVSTIKFISFYAHTTSRWRITQQINACLSFNTSFNASTLVFFTADHFILFVHSSRMFCCFVYFACSCRRLLSATAGCRPPACCLPACCHWEHRSVPFIL